MHTYIIKDEDAMRVCMERSGECIHTSLKMKML